MALQNNNLSADLYVKQHKTILLRPLMSSKGRKGSRVDRDGGRDARRDVRDRGDRGGSRRERDRDTNRDRDRGDTRSWRTSSGSESSSKSKPRDGNLPPFPKQRGYLKGNTFPRREQPSSRFEGELLQTRVQECMWSRFTWVSMVRVGALMNCLHYFRIFSQSNSLI